MSMHSIDLYSMLLMFLPKFLPAYKHSCGEKFGDNENVL